MDIVTHAGIGLIAASPFLETHPEVALGLAAGSVLPDLDACARLIAKSTFLRAHQTWSHAIPVQLAAAVIVGIAGDLFGGHGLALAAGLFAGSFIHTLLDMTNTFGVAWLLPLSSRRVCFEWVFFIDAVMFAATLLTLALMIPNWIGAGEVSGWYAAIFFAFCFAYILIKGMLRKRAGSYCAEARSLVPSALVPWRFYGAEISRDSVTLFHVNAINGNRRVLERQSLFDATYLPALEASPDFRAMRQLSTAYHVIRAEQEGETMRLLCRDLRIRNFGTRFGDLEVWLDKNHQIIRSTFHA
jgi:inner membrane protein